MPLTAGPAAELRLALRGAALPQEWSLGLPRKVAVPARLPSQPPQAPGPRAVLGSTCRQVLPLPTHAYVLALLAPGAGPQGPAQRWCPTRGPTGQRTWSHAPPCALGWPGSAFPQGTLEGSQVALSLPRGTCPDPLLSGVGAAGQLWLRRGPSFLLAPGLRAVLCPPQNTTLTFVIVKCHPLVGPVKVILDLYSVIRHIRRPLRFMSWPCWINGSSVSPGGGARSWLTPGPPP